MWCHHVVKLLKAGVRVIAGAGSAGGPGGAGSVGDGAGGGDRGGV